MTPSYKNVNCVFFSCDGMDPGGGYVGYLFKNALFAWAIAVPLSYIVFRWIYQKRLCE